MTCNAERDYCMTMYDEPEASEICDYLYDDCIGACVHDCLRNYFPPMSEEWQVSCVAECRSGECYGTGERDAAF